MAYIFLDESGQFSKNDGDKFMNILKDNIIGESKELFAKTSNDF